MAAAPTLQPFCDEKLNKLTVEDLLKLRQGHEQLVTISSDSTVEAALNILAQNKIMSAPYTEAKTNKVVGLFHMFDVLRFISKLYKGTTQMMLKLDREDFTSWWKRVPLSGSQGVLEDRSSELFATSVGELVAQSEPLESRTKTIPHDALLADLLGLFSGPCYSVLVTKNGEPWTIVSQSDFINFFWSEKANLEAVNLKLIDAKMGLDVNVVGIDKSDMAFEAFFIMERVNVRAVPILEKGRIVDSISISDLCGLKAENFPSLLFPVSEYLGIYGPQPKPAPITVTPNSTVFDVVDLFHSSRVHRLWVVDANLEVVGVVSLTDLCSLFNSFLAKK